MVLKVFPSITIKCKRNILKEFSQSNNNNIRYGVFPPEWSNASYLVLTMSPMGIQKVAHRDTMRCGMTDSKSEHKNAAKIIMKVFYNGILSNTMPPKL